MQRFCPLPFVAALALAATQIVMVMADAAGQSAAPASPATSGAKSNSPIVGPMSWTSSSVLVAPVSDDAHQIVSVKDPSVVFYNDMWHVYATTANEGGNWSIVYLTFKDWSEAAKAKPFYIDQNPELRGYHCAPQVFYFRPQKKWYLIYQSQHPQYSTADDPSKPETWTKPENFFASTPSGMPRLPIDYWVICDDAHAYLSSRATMAGFTAAARRSPSFPRG